MEADSFSDGMSFDAFRAELENEDFLKHVYRKYMRYRQERTLKPYQAELIRSCPTRSITKGATRILTTTSTPSWSIPGHMKSRSWSTNFVNTDYF